MPSRRWTDPGMSEWALPTPAPPPQGGCGDAEGYSSKGTNCRMLSAGATAPRQPSCFREPGRIKGTQLQTLKGGDSWCARTHCDLGWTRVGPVLQPAASLQGESEAPPSTRLPPGEHGKALTGRHPHLGSRSRCIFNIWPPRFPIFISVNVSLGLFLSPFLCWKLLRE